MYKDAPTWLWNKKGETKLFSTQKEVDRAWEIGWFGPAGYLKSKKPISEQEFESKRLMEEAIDADPRYEGLTINLSRTVLELKEKIVRFEVENGILEEPKDEDEDDEEECEDCGELLSECTCVPGGGE